MSNSTAVDAADSHLAPGGAAPADGVTALARCATALS